MNRQRVALMIFVALLATTTLLVRAQAEEKRSSNDPALERWLAKFPAADADGDGVLTEAEAREFRANNKGKAGENATEQSEGAATAAIAPTHSDVSYGPHERNVLDFWQAQSDGPSPVLVYFHGGSFKAGDKSNVLKRPVFEGCLKAGISVVSANYRYSTQAPFPAPMLDGARAVQFVRSKAPEWDIDPAKVALSGGSAGGTMALWIALHDDLANPGSSDPVLQNTTRVSAVVGYGAPASMEPEYILKHAGSGNVGGGVALLFGLKKADELAEPMVKEQVRDASPINHVSKGDPPLWLTYHGELQEAPFPVDAPQNKWIHHVCLGMPLKDRYDELGLDCRIHDRGSPAAEGSETGFLLEFFGGIKDGAKD
jgi:acetyl esterase